ncbi:MAG: biotin/lipoyl-containing protein, partial [Mycobacteriaceae bacterium]
TALAKAKIHGVVTNRDLLVNVLRHAAFLAGDTDTAFFATHGLDTLSGPLASPETERLSALAAALAQAAANRQSAKVNGALPSAWRNVPSQPQVKVFASESDVHKVDYRFTRTGLRSTFVERAELESATPSTVVLFVDGLRRRFDVARYGDLVCVDTVSGASSLTVVPKFVDPASVVAAGSLVAPMPGAVVRLGASVGDTVMAGQPLLWLEAMKMEHSIAAPAAGILTELPVNVGQQVDVGTILAVVTASDTEETP